MAKPHSVIVVVRTQNEPPNIHCTFLIELGTMNFLPNWVFVITGLVSWLIINKQASREHPVLRPPVCWSSSLAVWQCHSLKLNIFHVKCGQAGVGGEFVGMLNNKPGSHDQLSPGLRRILGEERRNVLSLSPLPVSTYQMALLIIFRGAKPYVDTFCFSGCLAAGRVVIFRNEISWISYYRQAYSFYYVSVIESLTPYVGEMDV